MNTGSLLVLRYIQTCVVIGRLLQLNFQIYDRVVNLSHLNVNWKWFLRYVISLWYLYQIRNLFNCRDNFFQILILMMSYFIWMEVSCRIQRSHYSQLYMYPIFLSYTYSGNGRVWCCYHQTAWVWKRTDRAKEIDEIIKNCISNIHVNQ
jgi:hypothetical protein